MDCYVMGINMSNHDRSVAICKNGEILTAIAEERLDRRKHSDGFYARNPKDIVLPPLKAINYCLSSINISIDDLDSIVVGKSINNCIETAINYIPIKNKNKIVELSNPYHHLTHAASAVYSSGMDNGYAIVIDEQGDWISQYKFESISLYKIKDNKITEIDKQFGDYDNISLGMFYDIISYCLGFSDSGIPAAGKTMGLSAYGNDIRYNKRFFKIEKGDIRFLFDNFIEFLYEYKLINKRIKRTDLPKKVEKTTIITEIAKYIRPINWQMDRAKKVASIAQSELEKSVFEYLKFHLKNISNEIDLCSSGGVFLNTNLNTAILSMDNIRKYYPFPASTDDGCSIGMAYLGSLSKNIKAIPLKSIYLGKKHDKEEILSVLDDNQIEYEFFDNPEKEIAKYLNEGMIIGIYQGKSEFGPRALGNRSIIAKPDSIKIRDRLNLNIKHREPFRPLAPIVQSDCVEKYFEGVKDSPYMLFVSKVIDSRLIGITHYDNTARIQTVTRSQNQFMYNLLSEYSKVSDLNVCINTSFNVNNEPIVETPLDAINNFILSDMDILLMDNFIIKRKNLDIKYIINKRKDIMINNKEGVFKILKWHTKNHDYSSAKVYFELLKDTYLFNTLTEDEYIDFLIIAINIYNHYNKKIMNEYIEKLLKLNYPKINFSDFYKFRYFDDYRQDKSHIKHITKSMKKIEQEGIIKYLEELCK
ncbi:TPA: carbamoyltransferase C-terminal domain-containing protein [Streptococcus pyogenes]